MQLPPASAHRWQAGGIAWLQPADVVPGGVSCLDAREGTYALTDGETVRVFSADASPQFLGVSQIERQPRNNGFVLRTRTFA